MYLPMEEPVFLKFLKSFHKSANLKCANCLLLAIKVSELEILIKMGKTVYFR